jgi:hypothetical protein
MKSVSHFEPSSDRFILLVDRKHEIPDQNYANIVWLEELGIEQIEYKAFLFDVLELNTNVKPSMLKFLLGTYENCIYFDPDIILYSTLQYVWQELANSNIVLTPHIIDPVHVDSYPWDQDLLRYGGFNLGFVGMRKTEETMRLLDWWENKCLTSGFNAPSDGFFVDQKYMDHAHVFFNGVKVLRHKGLNIAYWNLKERLIKRENDKWVIGDDDLIFIHFSGFIYAPKKADAHKFTKYPCALTLNDRPVLNLFCDDYRMQLKNCGYENFIKLPYSFSKFDNGVSIPSLARRLIASGAVKVNNKFDSPFLSGGEIYTKLLKIIK